MDEPDLFALSIRGHDAAGSLVSIWTQTYTGRKFHPIDPNPLEVHIEDIAHALAHICRYGGHVKRHYSVAEHSVLVSQFVHPDFAREALLHDAAEAYIGDMVRPLKRAMQAFKDAEAKVEAAVAQAFGLRTDEVTIAAWKEIDDRILIDETNELMANPGLYCEYDWFAKMVPLGAEILGYTPERAEQLFLLRFWELFPERCPPGLKISVDDLEIL